MYVLRVIVQGRVQGVGFRWFVRQEARRLGLAGWVRNLSDGSVELEVAGAEPAVRRLIDHVSVGPDAADVSAVREEPSEPATTLPYPFTIVK